MKIDVDRKLGKSRQDKLVAWKRLYFYKKGKEGARSLHSEVKQTTSRAGRFRYLVQGDQTRVAVALDTRLTPAAASTYQRRRREPQQAESRSCAYE